MAEGWDESFDRGSQSDESYQLERTHIEPIYDSFVCLLTKQVMRDPVTLENGKTFEREAIERWFKECRESGRKPVCPLTQKELKSIDLNPSMALRSTIEEWTTRNEAALLDIARRTLSQGNSERDIMQALKYIQHICQKSRSNKHVVRTTGLIPMIVDTLKSSSRRVRCKTLETLRIVTEEDSDNKVVLAEGDIVRTIVKFLSHELSREREEAVSLLYELSKSEVLCEKIGSVNGAILILVGMTSSNLENVPTVEKADRTLENLEKSEKNVLQMAENGRLQPLLMRILEGPPETKLTMAAFLGELVLSNDKKLLVAKTVGSSLVNIMRSSNVQSREAGLKALNATFTTRQVRIEARDDDPFRFALFHVPLCFHTPHHTCRELDRVSLLSCNKLSTSLKRFSAFTLRIYCSPLSPSDGNRTGIFFNNHLSSSANANEFAHDQSSLTNS